MLGNKSQLQRENDISVTNFINPQRFWYHNIDVPLNTLREFQELETQLQKQYAGKNVSREFVPKVGDIVAVNFVSWNKVIRGRIESLAEFSHGATEYIIWALDYGFPFQSRIGHVHSMNKAFLKRIDRIRCGAIADILPAETVFDFVLAKGKMVTQNMWNRHAIESLEKLINDAASVVFIEKFQAPENGTFFGDLKIVNHTSKEFLASQFLIEINVAIEAPNFCNIYSTLMTTKIPCWQTNNRNSKFIKNELMRGNMNFLNSNNSAVGSEQQCDLLAKIKVADWCARNENFADSTVSYVTTPTDCHDISCDDSVSVKHIKTTQTQKSYDKALITNRPVNQVKCIIPSNSTDISEKQNKQLARNPHQSCLSEDALYALSKMDLSSDESCSNVSLESKETLSKKNKETLFEDNKKSVNPPNPSEMQITLNQDEQTTETSETQKYLGKQQLIELRRKMSTRATKKDKTLENIVDTSTASSNPEDDSNTSIGTVISSKFKQNIKEVNERKALKSENAEECSSVNATKSNQIEVDLTLLTTRENVSNKLSGDLARANRLMSLKKKLKEKEEYKCQSQSQNDNISKLSGKQNPEIRDSFTCSSAEKANERGHFSTEADTTSFEFTDDTMSLNSSAMSSVHVQVQVPKMSTQVKQSKLQSYSIQEDNSKFETSNNASTLNTVPNRLKMLREKIRKKAASPNQCNTNIAKSTTVEDKQDTRKLVLSQPSPTTAVLSDDSESQCGADRISKKATKLRELSKKLREQKTFEGVMVPAGFDITNLKRYNDEENHWHRKETTRGEYHPHDFSIPHNSNLSSGTNQDFRHTRSHTDKFKDKYKDEQVEYNDVVATCGKNLETLQTDNYKLSKDRNSAQMILFDEMYKENKFTPDVTNVDRKKSILDMPLPEINDKPLIGYISSNEKSVSSKSQQPAGKPEIKNSKIVNADGHNEKNVDSMKDSKKHNDEKNLCNIRRELYSHDSSSNSQNSFFSCDLEQDSKHIDDILLENNNRNSLAEESISSQIEIDKKLTSLNNEKISSVGELHFNDSSSNSPNSLISCGSEHQHVEKTTKVQMLLPEMSISDIADNSTGKSFTETSLPQLLNTLDKVNKEESLSSSSRSAYSQVEALIARVQAEKNSDCEAILNRSSSTTSLISNSNVQMLSETGTINQNKKQTNILESLTTSLTSPESVITATSPETAITPTSLKKSESSSGEASNRDYDIRYPNSRRSRSSRSVAASATSALPINPMLTQRVSHISTNIKGPKLLEISGETSFKTNLTHHLVLAHSRINVNPLNEIADACLPQEIMQDMQKLKLTKLFRLQAYAWSHLVRGNSLFLVSPAKSAKTWSYLPPICSLVSYRLEERQTMHRSYGPVAIIIVASSVHAEFIASYCRRILTSTKTNISIVPSYGFRNEVEVKIELHNGCGILVVTPSSLLRLLNDVESFINPARLRHVIIDDMDLMLSRSHQDFEAVLKLILKKNPSHATVPYQLVVTTREWHPMMVGLIRLSNQPLVCFGDYLEAAVYGKAQISIKLRSNITKITSVLHFIEQHSIEFERLLIICNSHDDMLDVVQSLTEAGHPCISYSHSSSPASLIAINEWKLSKVLCNQILVCTDMVLPELAIQNVQNLIHYSMPTSWSKFIFRFSVLFETYENMVNCDFPPTIAEERIPKSLILLDEQNNIQLPRLIEFMKKHNQSKHIHSDIMTVARNIIVKREESRISEGKMMCPQMLEFSDCDEFGCQYRHNLTRFDGVFDGVPRSGDIRIHILKVFSPTHYAARLLELKTKGCTNWEIIRRSNEAAQFTLKLNMHYMNAEHHVIHWPLQINDLCIYKGRDNFHRCRILELPTISSVNVVRSINVKVKLIDMGTVIACDSMHLFECADEFKNFPPQAIDIRLLGVVPFDSERLWDTKSTQAIQRWIMSNITNKDCVHASINFALMDTIWMNNVIVMEKLETVGKYVYKVNVKRSLVEKKFGILDKKPSSLRKIAEEFGLVDKADEVKSSVESPPKENLPQNQVKNGNLITFSQLAPSDEPKQRGNSKKSDNLLEPITKEVPILPDNSSKSSDFLSKSKCVQKPQISNLIAGQWAVLVPDQLTEIDLQDCENGKWNEFYVHRHECKDLKRYAQLEKIIAEYVKNGNTRNGLEIDDARFVPMQNCLFKFDGIYCRAKIHSIFGSGSNKLYRIFLCDYGSFTELKSEDIRNDSDLILEITNEIIKFMPFQAVRCKLTGIRLDDFSRLYKVEEERLLAYVVKEYASPTGFDINSYEILLYECTADDALSAPTMVNRAIVNLGIATYDEETKHFLDLELVKFDSDSNNDNTRCEKATSNFEDLVKCFENSLAILQEEEGALKSGPRNAVCASQKPKESLRIEEMLCESEEQNVQRIVPSQPLDKLPLLKPLHKQPNTIWYETDCLIYLKIYAPDVVDYYLEVTFRDVIFVAEIQNEKHVLVLNLLGTVEPKYVSHEIRGLYVIVQLVKMVFMKWPRLLEQSTKFPWLSYDYDRIDTSEINKLMPSQSEYDSPRRTPNDDYNSDFSDSDDSESNVFKTFTPITNSEDVHDPSTELF